MQPSVSQPESGFGKVRELKKQWNTTLLYIEPTAEVWVKGDQKFALESRPKCGPGPQTLVEQDC